MKTIFSFFLVMSVSIAAMASSETFKMYTRPHGVVFPECYDYVELKLSEGTAHFENRVGGLCKKMVDPDTRFYNLSGKKDVCGSMIYTGGSEKYGVKIQDNRTRLCEDMQPALIITEETDAAGNTRKLYGNREQ